jgi:hypothetical protein
MSLGCVVAIVANARYTRSVRLEDAMAAANGLLQSHNSRFSAGEEGWGKLAGTDAGVPGRGSGFQRAGLCDACIHRIIPYRNYV